MPRTLTRGHPINGRGWTAPTLYNETGCKITTSDMGTLVRGMNLTYSIAVPRTAKIQTDRHGRPVNPVVYRL